MIRYKKCKITPSIILSLSLIVGYIISYYAYSAPKITEILTGCYAIVGVVLIIRRKRISKNLWYGFLLSGLALIHSQSSEGLRYFLLLIVLICWSRFFIESFIKVVSVLIFFGIATSIGQIRNGVGRLEGFVHSPPQFACIMMICLTYLLIYILNNWRKNHKQDFIINISLAECVACIFLIFKTGTRSILLVALIETLYFVALFLVQTVNFKHKKIALITLLMLAGVIILIFANSLLSYYYEKSARSVSMLQDSNSTRIYLITTVLNEIKNDPATIIFGKGGGFVEKLLGRSEGMTGYLPVHQDFILILAEYGILGFVLIYYILLKKHKALPLFLLMYIPCSFHNVILNTRAMILMVIVMNQVERRGYLYFPSRKRNAAINIDRIKINKNRPVIQTE